VPIYYYWPSIKIFISRQNPFKGIVQPLKRGGHEKYQSIDLIFMYHSINFLTFFKGPRPFKQQKTILSGLTTHLGASLDHVASAAKKLYSGMPWVWFFLDSGWGQSKSVHLTFFEDFLPLYGWGGEGATQVGAPEAVTFFLISLFIRNSIYM
jgi:hypothetical protein